jgi:hypothetical protein
MAALNKSTQQMDANPKEEPEELFEGPVRQMLQLSSYVVGTTGPSIALNSSQFYQELGQIGSRPDKVTSAWFLSRGKYVVEGAVNGACLETA